jgi:hypothetical protein
MISARLLALGSLLIVAAGCGRGGCYVSPAALGAQQEGHFKAVGFDKTCGERPVVQGLTIDVTGEIPVFAMRTEEDGLCTWAISSVVDGRALPIMSVKENLGKRFVQTSLAAGMNGTFWAIVDNRYAHFMRDEDARFPSVVKDARPVSLSSTATGRVYAIESYQTNKPIESFYLVDVKNRRSLPLLSDRFAWPYLQRALDGNVYIDGRVRYLGGTSGSQSRECSRYRVESVGRSQSERLELQHVGDCGILGKDGASWKPMIYGVWRQLHGERKYYYPVEQESACVDRGNRPGLIVADQLGNVWFVYRKLWHIDPAGRLSSTNLPVSSRDPLTVGERYSDGYPFGSGQLVAANDGTVWVTDESSLYQFVREP